MSTVNLMQSVISEFDITLLERIAPRKYSVVGKPPEYYTALYSDLNAPWKISDFLEFFLDTAELFFETESNENSIISSGAWQEDGISAQNALIAYAMISNGKRIIVIRRLKDEFNERQTILQRARENLLEQRRLRIDASYDVLSGLYNKRTFQLVFREAIKNARLMQSPLSVLMMDIDDFKIVNDTYGHIVGDTVLSEIGELLFSTVRTSDILARYGGEEFIMAVFGDIDQAMGVADKICRKIAAHKFSEPEHITISIGCAAFKRDDNEESLINRADQALYDAKKSGKNTFRKR